MVLVCERDTEDKSVQVDAQFNKLIQKQGVSHDISYGGSNLNNGFSINNVDHLYRTCTSNPVQAEMPDADVQKWGLFAQDQMYLMDEQLILTAGLRYD